MGNTKKPVKENLTKEEREELEQLRAEKLAREKAGLTLKVSAKGAVSVYGLMRFPVTLYRQQWERLIAMTPTIESFIKTHADELSVKSDAVKPVADDKTGPVRTFQMTPEQLKEHQAKLKRQGVRQ